MSEASEEVLKSLKVLESGRPVPGMTNSDELLAAHAAVTNGVRRFRFPPEPNGFLHIGHAKAMMLDFGRAAECGGITYLRYDDTNPEGEEQVYIDSIQEMVRWLGWQPARITYSSDYFQTLYDLAVQLIVEGKAYIDHSTSEQMKKQREARADSPWRDRPVAKSLELFEKMRQGRFAEGEAMLRLKMDMQSDNPNLRDVVAYRIKYSPHPRTGSQWCIYPSYDYTHCIVDSLEHMDYSLCTLEFETRRESYFWLLEALRMWRPHVWEFSRLNVTGSLLSKRKIIVLVREKIVRGFDDPRLLTLAGLRRRGYTPQAVNKFVQLVGITRSANVIDIRMLENACREDLDERCNRCLGVLNPVKVKIVNWQGTRAVDAPNHPRDLQKSTRTMTFSDEVFIDRADFRVKDDNAKYFGLAPGKTVGLKYSGNIKCVGFRCGSDGQVSEIDCEVDFDRTTKAKTNIGWVDCKSAVPVEFRLYEPLLTDDLAATVPDFMQYINAKSERVEHGFAEACVASLAPFDKVQLERVAFFSVDPDTTPGHLVMNRVLPLIQDREK